MRRRRLTKGTIGIPKPSDLWAAVLALCLAMGSAALGETDAIRIGRHFPRASETPYSQLGQVSAVLKQISVDMQTFVTGFRGCSDIVTRDLYDGTPRDKLSDTWTIIQSFRVGCWALLNFDPDMVVAPTGPEDRVTPEMIYKIMAKARQLNNADPEWAKSLVTFFGGTITCKDKERCRLQSADGGEWKDYFLYFDLLAVQGDDWFIEVTNAYWSQEGLVYGVWWREGPSGGRVMAVYPVMYWTTDRFSNATTWQRNGR